MIHSLVVTLPLYLSKIQNRYLTAVNRRMVAQIFI
jgi:hypothetical protein